MMHARAREPEQKTVAPSSSMPIAPREENDAERGQPLSSSSSAHLSMPAKLLLLSQLLGRDGVITNNGRAWLKERIIRGDAAPLSLLKQFEQQSSPDGEFIDGVHMLIEEEAHAAHKRLFANCSLEKAKGLSRAERAAAENEERSLIYGEVDFRSFSRVLRSISPEPGSVFYDLGSGTGRAVFVARLTQDFRSCIGVEILSGLHEQAMSIAERYSSTTQQVLTEQLDEVAFHHANFLNFDWSDGDVVFANSTCFDDDLMDSLGERAELLKPGAFLITFTKGISSSQFQVLGKRRYRMSWGPATVYVHQRLGLDGRPMGRGSFSLPPTQDGLEDEEDESASEDEEEDEEHSSSQEEDRIV